VRLAVDSINMYSMPREKFKIMWMACDRQTDGQTHDDSIYYRYTSILARGNKTFGDK